MRHTLFAVLISLLCFACAAKDESNTQGMVLEESGADMRHVAPTPELPLVHLSCEPFRIERGLVLTNSVKDPMSTTFLPVLSTAKFASPLILERIVNSTQMLGVSAGAIQWLDMDINRGAEVSRVILGKAPALKFAKEISSQLGFSAPKAFTKSSTESFFALGEEGAYSIRSTDDPRKEIAKWKLKPDSYFNPRWQGNLVFFDGLEDGKFVQFFGRVVKGKLQAFDSLPAPLTSSSHQLGVRRFDRENLVWLEWNNGKAVLRFMNLLSRAVFNLKIPKIEKLSMGFGVLHEDRVGHLFVLSSASGLHFFRLNLGKIETLESLPFTDSMKQSMQILGWKFVSLFSVQNDTQLFAQIPDLGFSGAEPMIFSLRDGELHRLGSSGCINPGLFEDRNQ